MGFLSKLFKGKKAKPQQMSLLTPGQDQRLSGMLGMGNALQPQIQSLLGQLLSGSPEAMEAYQAPAMRQFNEQIMPSIAERFSSMSASGQRSGAFNRAAAGAGASLAENLQAQRAGLQQNALQQALGLYQAPLGVQAFQPMMRQAQPGLLQGLMGGAGRLGGAYLGTQLGIPDQALGGMFGTGQQVT